MPSDGATASRAARPRPKRARSSSCGGYGKNSPTSRRRSICRSSCCSCSGACSLACRCPSIKLDTDYLNGLLASGPILQFEHLPIEWSDVRFLLRATAVAMRNHEALDDADVRRIDALCRDASRLPAVMRSWYDSVRPGRIAHRPGRGGARDGPAAGMRPGPDALRRCDPGQDRSCRLDASHLPAVRRRAGLRGHHARRRAHADLRPLRRALALRPDGLPVLPQRRTVAGSRHWPAATAAIGSPAATRATATSRPSMRAVPHARSCRPSTASPRCRSMRPRFKEAINEKGAALRTAPFVNFQLPTSNFQISQLPRSNAQLPTVWRLASWKLEVVLSIAAVLDPAA